MVARLLPEFLPSRPPFGRVMVRPGQAACPALDCGSHNPGRECDRRHATAGTPAHDVIAVIVPLAVTTDYRNRCRDRCDRRNSARSCRPHGARGLGVGAVTVMIAGNRGRRELGESWCRKGSGGGPRVQITAPP
jgi:hypothetical protein